MLAPRPASTRLALPPAVIATPHASPQPPTAACATTIQSLMLSLEVLLALAPALGRLALALLLDVGAHVLEVAELVAHGLGGLLLVGSAVVCANKPAALWSDCAAGQCGKGGGAWRRTAGLGVEVADGRPARASGLHLPAVRTLNYPPVAQVDVAEGHAALARLLFDDRVPGRRLLLSSASASGGNPAHERRAACAHAPRVSAAEQSPHLAPRPGSPRPNACSSPPATPPGPSHRRRPRP